MKQSEFQDSIEWIDGMNYCAVDANSAVWLYKEKPHFKGLYWLEQPEKFLGFIPVNDPENWLFSKEEEL